LETWVPQETKMTLALEPIINGDSLLRDGYFSVVVEWRSARTLRMVRR